MEYFGYMAKQVFRTTPSGQRMFYRGGPWSRPYIVPDDATEKRLYTKQLWIFRVLVGGLILVQPFLYLLLPNVLERPLWFLGYMAAVLVGFQAVSYLVFRSELRRLERPPARIPLRVFYTDMAARHSATALTLGLVGSVAFVIGGAAIVLMGQNLIIASICTAFFCLVASSWGYMLWLKSQ